MLSNMLYVEQYAVCFAPHQEGMGKVQECRKPPKKSANYLLNAYTQSSTFCVTCYNHYKSKVGVRKKKRTKIDPW